MNKLLSILFSFFSITLSWAGTPIMDGNFDGTGVWGNPRATADGVAGWANANAKNLYITADANYIYLGATVITTSYFYFAFIINTKPGGAEDDAGQRKIVFNHTNKPDYIFRGDFGHDEAVNGNDFGNIAFFNSWDGTQWTGIDTRITNNGTTYSVADNIPNDFSGTLVDGFIEVRIARSAMNRGDGQVGILDVSTLDVQFCILGYAQNQGSFDAVPNDNNADAFTLSNPISLSHYAAPFAIVGVTWLDFFAKAKKESSIDLSWSTASEKQNSYFDIERSANGQDWTKIGTVKGHGTSSSENSYLFTDNAPLPHINYYRLKQVDFDGKFEYSTTVSINMGTFTKGFSIFPNPVADRLYFTSNNLDIDGTLQVFDMKGVLLKTTQLIDYQLDVHDLPVGLYQIRLIDRTGVTLNTERFVKKD